MKEKLQSIKEEALAQIQAADAPEKLNDVKVRFLGKKGELTAVLKGMKDVAAEDRPKVGQLVNEAREEIETALNNAKTAMEKAIREAKLKEYLNQQQEIKHQEAVIEKLRSFNREKSIRRAESREKMLEKMDVIEKPMGDPQELHFSLEPSCVSGNDVLEVEHLSKAFGNHKLFQDISFEIHRGEHVAIIGDNGTGKTTLLKIINQVVSADEGSFTLGSKVKIGYYDQEHHVLHDEKTIFDEISDDYPSLTHTQIRNTLAAFQFTGEEVFKQIRTLSGGEKGRVSLAKLMLSEANFLILDEPTNHLDMESITALNNGLIKFPGVLLFTSRDHQIVQTTANRIMEILPGGKMIDKITTYDEYLASDATAAKRQAILDLNTEEQDD